jgi:hypothetical protein
MVIYGFPAVHILWCIWAIRDPEAHLGRGFHLAQALLLAVFAVERAGRGALVAAALYALAIGLHAWHVWRVPDAHVPETSAVVEPLQMPTHGENNCTVNEST